MKVRSSLSRPRRKTLGAPAVVLRAWWSTRSFAYGFRRAARHWTGSVFGRTGWAATPVREPLPVLPLKHPELVFGAQRFFFSSSGTAGRRTSHDSSQLRAQNRGAWNEHTLPGRARLRRRDHIAFFRPFQQAWRQDAIQPVAIAK